MVSLVPIRPCGQMGVPLSVWHLTVAAGKRAFHASSIWGELVNTSDPQVPAPVEVGLACHSSSLLGQLASPVDPPVPVPAVVGNGAGALQRAHLARMAFCLVAESLVKCSPPYSSGPVV